LFDFICTWQNFTSPLCNIAVSTWRETDLRSQLVDQQMPERLCFCSAFRLSPFIRQICALVYADECGSALALFVCWWKYSKLLGEVLSPENTPVRILLYGFRRQRQRRMQPTDYIYVTCESNLTKGRRERVLLHQRATKHIQESLK
jgi:hypothetical protein